MTPEAALSQAEKFMNEGQWEKAISTLHDALQNRRNKGNNSMMEKMMINLIDICVQNNNTVALKENLSKFRNYFQHQSMTLLESVFRYLIKETKQIMTDIEKAEGTQKICSLLTDDMSSGLP